MSIYLYEGEPGSGKTLMLTALCLENLKKGHHIYANFHIDWPGNEFHYYNDLRSLFAITDGIIAIDEAQTYFGARSWTDLPPAMMQKLQQHRKDGLNLLVSAQSVTFVDVVMRQLVTRLYRLVKIPIPFLNRAFFIVRQYNLVDGNKAEKLKFKFITFYFGKHRPGEMLKSIPKTLNDAYDRYDTIKKIERPKDSFVKDWQPTGKPTYYPKKPHVDKHPPTITTDHLL